MSIRDRYNVAAASLTAVIDAFSPADWSRPSVCDDWTANEVVDHMITTQRDMLTERGLDVGAAPDTHADPAGAWRAHCNTVLEVLADPSVGDTAYDGYSGPTTIGQTLEQFYVFDMIVHRWDLAQALGRNETLTVGELDHIDSSIAVFGPHMYAPGLFVEGIEPENTNDRQSVVLATMGRRPKS
jgi:uncharacterized protein (TIGR03086 family)